MYQLLLVVLFLSRVLLPWELVRLLLLIRLLLLLLISQLLLLKVLLLQHLLCGRVWHAGN
jgi:hypothetical protein